VKKAIYPGTFDPVTNGHLDILKRAIKLFDEVIVAVAYDNNKNPLFTLEERTKLLEESVKGWPGVKVIAFEGLTVEFARKQQAQAIIRGLRFVSDFEHEFQLALTNKKLAPEIETVFLMTSSDYSYISSSTIKWIGQLKGNISDFVPPHVEQAILEKFKTQRK